MAMKASAEPVEEPATPEEEAAMQAALEWAEGKLFGDEQALRAMAKMVKAAPSPAEGLGSAAAQLAIGCDRELDLPETVILPFCEQVLVMVAELLEEAGAADWSEDDLSQAMFSASQIVMGEYGADEEEMQMAAGGQGDYSPASLQQLSSQFKPSGGGKANV